MSLVQQAPSNNTQTSNEATASEFISVMRGIKEYLQNSNCSECKGVLTNIFFKENKVAGSTGT